LSGPGPMEADRIGGPAGADGVAGSDDVPWVTVTVDASGSQVS